MKVANTHDLVALVDSADADGRVCLQTYGATLRTHAQAREWLTITFLMTPLLTHRIEVVKKAIDEIDLTVVATDADTALIVNLAKLLQLPAVAPASELAEFRDMLLALRAFFEARPKERCNVQICNHRDRNKRVFGTLSCRIPDGEHKYRSDDVANAALKARIDNSPALSAWLRGAALSLQKRGPWASFLIREHDLFGFGQGPHSDYLFGSPVPESSMPLSDKLEVLDI